MNFRSMKASNQILFCAMTLQALVALLHAVAAVARMVESGDDLPIVTSTANPSTSVASGQTSGRRYFDL